MPKCIEYTSIILASFTPADCQNNKFAPVAVGINSNKTLKGHKFKQLYLKTSRRIFKHKRLVKFAAFQ